MRTTRDYDLALVCLQLSPLGPRAKLIVEEATTVAMRRSQTYQLPAVLQEIDLLCATLCLPGGEQFVEEYLHPERSTNVQRLFLNPKPNPPQSSPSAIPHHD